MFPSTSSRETLRFSGNKIHCSPRDQSLSVNITRYERGGGVAKGGWGGIKPQKLNTHGPFNPRGEGAIRLTLCEAPTRYTRPVL